MIIKQFGIKFGVLSDSIINQVEAQGFRINKAVAKSFEKDRQAINRLIVRGLLTESQLKICFQKLLNKICQQVEVG